MEADPLTWWHHNCKVFPLLSKLARKYLSVCATSSHSERLFSSGGHVVNSLRGNLNPERVNMLVFLKQLEQYTCFKITFFHTFFPYVFLHALSLIHGVKFKKKMLVTHTTIILEYRIG